jgi:hypothetical protein
VPAPPGAAGDASGHGSGGAGQSGAADGGGDAPTGRLVPWQLEAKGSPPLVLGIFDTAEQQHCRFVPDAEGQLRCMPELLAPIGLAPQVGSIGLTAAFADPECQVPVYNVPVAMLVEAASQFVLLPLPEVGGCEPRRYTVANLAPVAPSAKFYTGEPCAETYRPVVAGIADVTAKNLVPPERYVAGTRVDGPRFANRLRLQQVTTEEGANFDDRVFDEQWGSLCKLAETDPPHCIPDYAEHLSNHYQDETCTMPVWQVPACETPTFIVGDSGFADQNHALGEPYSGPVWVYYGHGGCMPKAPPGIDGPDHFFLEGPALAEHPLASFQFQAEGNGNLRARGVVGDDGSSIVVSNELASWRRFHDEAAGEDCDVVYTPEGLARCVPRVVLSNLSTVGAYTFADDQCTQPAHFCYDWSYRHCEGGLAVLVESDAGGRLLPQSVHPLNKLPPGGYVSFEGSPCTFDPNLMPLYALGDEIPWDTFSALTERNGRTPPSAP